MRTYHNPSLKNFNTFRLDESADEVWVLQTEEDLIALATNPDALSRLKLILGGGSNLLLTQPVKGLVAHIALRGIKVIHQNENMVRVEVQAGENWHDFVRWTVEEGYGGLENLSLIPGQVGTAPVQNIGAYGVELKDHFVSLEGIELGTGKKLKFNKEDCQFGYRDSVFKRSWKNRLIIKSVVFQLTTKNHLIRTDYGAIQSQLEKMEIDSPSIDDVSKAVIEIRRSKLPDPAEIGNSGSFFKNPLVSISEYERVKAEFPEVIAYPAGDQMMKLAAGWLIEKAGWKGYRERDAGVHNKQALVLVNYGNAKGSDIYKLAQRIIVDIKNRFGVELEPEVNIL